MMEKGKRVFITNSIPSNAMEGWVQQVAQRSEQAVDWHFFGGRAVVMTLGDPEVVRTAIIDLLPEHDKLQFEACGRDPHWRSSHMFL
jgi:hypothetical protein